MFRTWIGILGWQAVGIVAATATVALASRLVPPAEYGRYWLALSIVQVVTGVVLSWVGQSVLLFAREEVHRTGDMRTTMLSALAVQAALFGLICATGIALYRLFPHYLVLSPVELGLVLALVGLLAAGETTSSALQAMQRYTGFGIASAVAKLGPFLAMLAIWAGVPASALALLTGVAAGMMAALALNVAAMPGRSAGASISTHAIRRIVSYGAGLPIAIAAGLASTWMHAWFVQAYGGSADAGIYGWAASLHALAIAALPALAATLSPHLFDLVLEGRHDSAIARVRFFVALGVLATAALPLVLAAVLAMMWLVPAAYAGAGPVLVALLAAFPAQFISMLSGALLRAFPAMTGAVVAINSTVAIAGIALSFTLTSRFGAIGAALALSISMWLGTIVLIHKLRRPLGIEPSTAFGLTATCAIAAAFSIMAASLMPHLPPSLQPVVAVALCAILLAGARAAGALQPLAMLASVLPPTTPGLALLTALLGWCNRPRSDRLQ